MKKYIAMIAAAVVLLSTLVFSAVPAAADGTITINSIVPLMVNGITVAQFPATVDSGDRQPVIFPILSQPGRALCFSGVERRR